MVDQGDLGEFYDEDDSYSPDEELIEQMRKERRRKNDEYQFETYFKEILKDGGIFKGEWTVYRTSTFLQDKQNLHDENGFPILVPDEKIIKVISHAKKIPMLAQLDGIGPVPLTAIVHEERLATDNDFLEVGNTVDESIGHVGNGKIEDRHSSSILVGQAYWPEELFSSDFRGPSGIMCVGNAYTICHAEPLTSSATVNGVTATAKEDDEGLIGPYSQMCTELGITYKRMKYRIKLDYRIKELDKERDGSGDADSPSFPSLHLYSLIVCREALERWPRYNMDTLMSEVNVDDASTENLFRNMGAAGGLYDPPLTGSEKQSNQYMFIDLEGSASALFPFILDQDPLVHGSDAAWVTSLDWSPGRFRYQVDKKFLSGPSIRNLKTLELSEVETDQADLWRPRDGGMDMRQ